MITLNTNFNNNYVVHNINLNKHKSYKEHIPLSTLFYMDNKEYIFSSVSYYNIETTIDLENKYSNLFKNWLLDNESYTKASFLSNYNYHYRKVSRIQAVEQCSKTTIKKYSNTFIGSYSLLYNSNNDVLNYYCLLCVKKEYVYYVKLCILLNKEIEFDCFYLLVNNTLDFNKSTILKYVYNYIIKEIKKYDIPIIITDIENAISKKLEIPSFNTIKDMNNWLSGIVTEYRDYAVKDLKIKIELYTI